MAKHGQYRTLVIRPLAIFLYIGLASPVAASECRLALLLALDVSSSVDAAEDALQREGLAAALLAPEVHAAFFADDARVALAAYEWSGRYNQTMLLDWVMIQDDAALYVAAQTLGSSQRSETEFPTAMGYALGYGAGLLRDAPTCLTQKIDMSGDGQNNEGFPPAAAYAEFPFAGVTVNGLAINAGEYEAETGVVEFYQKEVLYGPGAFLEIANGFEDFERAMRRKLERELRPPSIGLWDKGTGRAPG